MVEIIKDITGGTLRLSKTKLTEVTGFQGQPYYLDLKRFAARLRSSKYNHGLVRIHTVAKRAATHLVGWQLPTAYNQGVIGCRVFSRRTFAKIVRAAKAAAKGKQ